MSDLNELGGEETLLLLQRQVAGGFLPSLKHGKGRIQEQDASKFWDIIQSFLDAQEHRYFPV